MAINLAGIVNNPAHTRRRKLEEIVMLNLHISRQEFDSWKTKNYNMDKEVNDTFHGILEKAKHIIIIGDYDCDGVCASYIFEKGLTELYPDKDIELKIPRKFTQGYGVNPVIIEEIMAKYPDAEDTVILTCDNGIAAKDVLKTANDAGYHVVLTDHHELADEFELPEAEFIVDPAVDRVYNPFQNRYYCGAGVAYKLLEPKLNTEMKQHLSFYAALATVADVMQLKEENWIMVRRTLEELRAKKFDKAIGYLFEITGTIPEFVNEETFGFVLGPIFNASGRMHDDGAMQVVEYLKDPTKEAAARLVEINEERKRLTSEQEKLVEEYIAENHLEHQYPMWLNVPGLHEGIIGIIAGHLKDKYKRPVFLATYNEHKQCLKGSGRSYGDFHMYHYMKGMKENFLGFGGHAGASGFSLTEEQFEQCVATTTEKDTSGETIHCDAEIKAYEIPETYKEQLEFAPYGEGNPKPVFRIEVDTQKMNAKMMGAAKNHLRIDGRDYRMLHWNHDKAILKDRTRFSMVGVIEQNVFQGQANIQFKASEVIDLDEELEK